MPFLFLTGWTLSVPVPIQAMTRFGYFKGLYDANIFASQHHVVRPEHRVRAVGGRNSTGYLGFGIAPGTADAAVVAEKLRVWAGYVCFPPWDAHKQLLYSQLRQLQQRGEFPTLGTAVRESIQLSDILQDQVDQGFSEVVLRNPTTNQEKTIIIPSLHRVSKEPK